MKKKKSLIGIGVIVILAAAGGRLASLKAATDYGQHVAAAFSMLGPEGLADTKELREFLRDPQLMGCENRAHNLAFLGGGYIHRIHELKRGLVYLSEQMSVPAGERFAKPPAFEHLSIDTSDPSDRGMGKAVGKLLLDYRNGF